MEMWSSHCVIVVEIKVEIPLLVILFGTREVNGSEIFLDVS